MIDPHIQRYIQLEIKKQMNVILAGISAENTHEVEGIDNLYPGMPTIEERPVMHPAGFVSRANTGTVQVTARHGDHIGNWMILGHRDKDRPDDLEPGEVILYNKESSTYVYLRKDGFEIESGGVKLLEQLIKLLTTIINARTNTIFGPQPLIPAPAGLVNGEEWNIIKQQLTTLKGGA